MQDDDRRDLVTVKHAALELGVNARRIRRWIDAGKLDAYVVGPTRRIRLRLADVERLARPSSG